MFIFANLSAILRHHLYFNWHMCHFTTPQPQPARLASYLTASHIVNWYGAAGGILRLADGRRGKQYDLMAELMASAM